MRIRSIIVSILGLAALAGAIFSGLTFATFNSANLPLAWLLHAAACTLVFMLGFTVRGGAHGIALLLSIFALCLPAIGPGIAALCALAIQFMRPAREEAEKVVIGNPASSNNHTTAPQGVLGRPLVEAVRKLELPNLFRLLTGIGSLPPRDSREVLIRLRDGEDAQLQLFAQGGLNAVIESSERHLKYLNQRAKHLPKEAATHCAIAEIKLHLLDNRLVEEDDRPAIWDEASESIGRALLTTPDDPLSLKICARLNLLGADPEKAKLTAEALAKIPGHEETAQMILAEAAFLSGELESVGSELENVTGGTTERDQMLDFWTKPKPAAYA